MRARFAVFLITLTLFFGASASEAHEGHDHSKENSPVGVALPRGSAASDLFELVAILRDGSLQVFVDHFKTNEPVTDARIEAETPEGPVELAAQDDGSFRLSASWAKSGRQYDLIFTVASGGEVEVLPVSIQVPAKQDNALISRSLFSASGLAGLTVFLLAAVLLAVNWKNIRARFAIFLIVGLFTFGILAAHAHEGEDHGPAFASSAVGRDFSQRLPDGSVFMPKEAQRLLAVRTAVTGTGEHFRAIELPGRIIPDPNASGFVQSALSGRLSPPANGFPTLGSKVQKGDILAYVTPPIQAIDISDMRQKEGELLQQISIVERRVVRFEQLIKSGAISKTQLEDAKLELNGLLERRAALEQSRREPEALRAPVSGIVAAANTVAGQLAQPSSVVFEIIDPSRLWVEALTFEPIAASAESSARLSNGRSIKLAYRGAGFAGRNQAIPVHFAITDAADGLWAGQFVSVYATGTEKQRAIAVPRSAVVRASNGQYVVYEHTAAEVFESREVRIAPLDSDRSLILSGLSAGKRIVVKGAELIDQVR